MTEEEAREYNELVSRYNRLVQENAYLEQEIELGINNCYVVADNISSVGSRVTGDMKILSKEVTDSDDVVQGLYTCLLDVTEHYFLFKNLSESSKMLTKYNDEYNTKFKYYHELRRITLGYVVGLDSHIVSSEALRKRVEKAYLANTDYWLAYAISAVMLWASDEQEAALRSLNKALLMDNYKSCVFFMLINLRFSRVDVARNWYISLLDRTDVNNMSDEWQHVLHAYLIGAMRNDKEFTDMASNYFKSMLEQVEATSANFSRNVIAKGKSYASAFVHVTDNEYPMLKETCGNDYTEMRDLLSDMEKISVMSIHFDEVYHMDDDGGENIYEQLENVLYDLVNGYDDEEFKIVKNLKYHEAVIAAKGDAGKANAKFVEMYGKVGQTRTFGDLMLEWAFAEDYVQTDITVKRFALSYLKDRIKIGVKEYFEERFTSLKEKYMFSIRTCADLEEVKVECDENSYNSASQKISKYYNKNKIKFVFKDSYIKIFLFLCGVALLLIAVAALSVGTKVFPVALTLGITLGIVSGFLTWRRWVDRIKELNERCRLSLVRLRNALEELANWRKLVRMGFKDLDDLTAAIDRF